MKKKCWTCKQFKEIEEFGVDNALPDGRRNHCKICFGEQKRKRQAEKRESAGEPLLECQICGEKLRHINNTHLKRHGLTIQEYQEKYGKEVFAPGLLGIQKGRREDTITERYTLEEIKYFHGEKAKQTREKNLGMTLSEFSRTIWQNISEEEKQRRQLLATAGIKQFYKDLSQDPEKHAKHKLARLEKRKATNLERYGVEFAQLLPATVEKQKATNLERFGREWPQGLPEIIEKTWQTMKKRYGKYCGFTPRFSLISQDCFRAIEERLLPENKCFYATNGNAGGTNEYQVPHRSGKVRYLDFYIPDLNLWIEFDEPHHDLERNKIKDQERTQQIMETLPRAKLIRIKQEEWLDDPDAVVAKVLNIINQGK